MAVITDFEPFFDSIGKLHNELYETLLKMEFVKKETSQFCLQCNYTEYVEEDHDKEYEWTHFCFDDDVNKDFALGINRLRFAGKEKEIKQIKEIVQKIWTSRGNKVTDLGVIKDVSAMKKEAYEMILSVHYWFDMSLIDDGINDSQYLKIVYTGSSMNDRQLLC